MKRTPMKRSGTIARRTPVKPRRSAPRRGPMRDQGYMVWLKDRKCVACESARRFLEKSGFSETKGFRITPPSLVIDPCHTVNNGRGSKGPDSSCIPLCRYHHEQMDGRLSTEITTKEQFAKKYGLDLAREAAGHYAAYQVWKETVS